MFFALIQKPYLFKADELEDLAVTKNKFTGLWAGLPVKSFIL